MKQLSVLLRSIRASEALPFCGVTLLGGLMAPGPPDCTRLESLVIPVASIFLLASFAFGFNDWQDLGMDRKSASKANRPLANGTLTINEMKCIVLATGAIGLALLPFGAPLPVVCAGAITIVLSFFYSWRLRPLKTVPLVSSLVHLVEGTLAFCIGWWTVAEPSSGSLMIGMYFGLVFAAGHLHHEVMDFEADNLCGIRSHAVRLGARPTLWAGFGVWCISAAWFSILAFAGPLDSILGWIQLAMFAGYLLSFLSHARGLPGPDALERTRRLYRAIYMIGGVLMVSAIMGGFHCR